MNVNETKGSGLTIVPRNEGTVLESICQLVEVAIGWPMPGNPAEDAYTSKPINQLNKKRKYKYLIAEGRMVRLLAR